MLLIIGQMRDIDLSSRGNIDGEGREYCKASLVWKDDCVEASALFQRRPDCCSRAPWLHPSHLERCDLPHPSRRAPAETFLHRSSRMSKDSRASQLAKEEEEEGDDEDCSVKSLERGLRCSSSGDSWRRARLHGD